MTTPETTGSINPMTGGMTAGLTFVRDRTRTFMALMRKDLKGYFDQPMGYLILVLFVAAVSWVHFFTGTIANNEASLRTLFDFMPFALALFVPAATMRLLSEEQRDGTLELLLTQPLRTWTVLGAKFTAGLIFVSVGIVATIGIPILMETAGDIDAGAAASQYIGAILLSATFVGVGLFTSSLSRNQLVALMLAVAINAVLIVIGLSFLTLTLPSSAAVLMEDLSPITHFRNIARGVIDLRDLIYFASVTILFLSGAYLMLRGRTLSHSTHLYKNLRLGVAGLVLGSILAGWFGASIGGRWDLTEDNLFTLSPATKNLVAELDDLLTINLYISSDPPVQIAGASRDIQNFLRDLDSTSDLVRVIKHEADKDDESEAKAVTAGVPAVQFQILGQTERGTKDGYLGMTLSYTDKREVIQFVESVDGLEYRVATLANKMVRRDKQTIGFLTGHGEKARGTDLRFLDSQLVEQYNLLDVRADFEGNLDLSGIDVIIIAGPNQPVAQTEMDQLDEFFARGGKGLILIDSTIADTQRFVARANPDNFNDFVLRYGVFVHENIVMDPESHDTLSFTTATGAILLPYPFWVKAPTVESKISGNTESILLPWAASIELVDRPEISAVDRFILVQSTDAGVLRWDYQDIEPQPELSAYGREGDEFAEQLLAVGISGRASVGSVNGDADFRMVVVGDSEWLTDPIAVINQGNIVLALNWVDWLAQEEALASIRSKVVTSRELLFSSNAHKNTVQYINIVGVPALLVLLGALRFWRRRQFSQKIYQPGGESGDLA
jgi:ABC-2 type transport system permease protein